MNEKSDAATSKAGNVQTRDRGQRGGSPVVTVIHVLRCFTVEHPLRGVSEIADQVGLHKSSVSRLLSTLEEERLVERDESSRKYRLGMGLIGIAGPLLAALDVRRIAYPVLEELCRQTGETAALTIWDGTASTCVEQIPSRQRIKHTSPMGTRYATPMSATVQVFLARQPEAAARELWVRSACAGADLDVARPARIEDYLERLAQVRRSGVAVNDGATCADEVGVAAAVTDHRGAVVASVLVAAPRYRTGGERVRGLATACRGAAEVVSRRLGSIDIEAAGSGESPLAPLRVPES